MELLSLDIFRINISRRVSVLFFFVFFRRHLFFISLVAESSTHREKVSQSVSQSTRQKAETELRGETASF